MKNGMVLKRQITVTLSDTFLKFLVILAASPASAYGGWAIYGFRKQLEPKWRVIYTKVFKIFNRFKIYSHNSGVQKCNFLHLLNLTCSQTLISINS